MNRPPHDGPFFHVAPREKRDAIQTDGCFWAAGGEDYDGDAEEFGVYLFDNLDDARRFATWAERVYPTTHTDADIWQLDLDLDLVDGLVEDAREAGGWMYPEVCLTPDTMRVLDQDRATTTAITQENTHATARN